MWVFTELFGPVVRSLGLTLAPFSGKHLHSPLQSLPPQGPLCFFPPCQDTKHTKHEGQKWAIRGQRWSIHNDNTLLSAACIHRRDMATFLFHHTWHGVWGKTVAYCRCDSLCLFTLWFGKTLVCLLLQHCFKCHVAPLFWFVLVQEGCFGCGCSDSRQTSRHNGPMCVHENPIHQRGCVRPQTETICLWMSAYQQNHPPSQAILC